MKALRDTAFVGKPKARFWLLATEWRTKRIRSRVLGVQLDLFA